MELNKIWVAYYHFTTNRFSKILLVKAFAEGEAFEIKSREDWNNGLISAWSLVGDIWCQGNVEFAQKIDDFWLLNSLNIEFFFRCFFFLSWSFSFNSSQKNALMKGKMAVDFFLTFVLVIINYECFLLINSLLYVSHYRYRILPGCDFFRAKWKVSICFGHISLFDNGFVLLQLRFRYFLFASFHYNKSCINKTRFGPPIHVFAFSATTSTFCKVTNCCWACKCQFEIGIISSSGLAVCHFFLMDYKSYDVVLKF